MWIISKWPIPSYIKLNKLKKKTFVESRGATLICCQLNTTRNWINYFIWDRQRKRYFPACGPAVKLHFIVPRQAVEKPPERGSTLFCLVIFFFMSCTFLYFHSALNSRHKKCYFFMILNKIYGWFRQLLLTSVCTSPSSIWLPLRECLLSPKRTLREFFLIV